MGEQIRQPSTVAAVATTATGEASRRASTDAAVATTGETASRVSKIVLAAIVDVELALRGSHFCLNPRPRSSPRRSSHYKRRTDNGHPSLGQWREVREDS